MNEAPQFKFAIREDLEDVADKFLPTRAEPFATGWDVRAAMSNRKDLVLRPGQYFKIPLGFRAAPPEGWWFNLHPRSSSFTKKYMHNLVGIIDEHYSHEVLFAGQYIPDINSMGHDLVIKFGDAVAQIIPFKRIEMKVSPISNKDYDDLCEKRMAIRRGGFGSTDSK
jgi:dUTPase